MVGMLVHFAFGLTIGFILIIILAIKKNKWLLYAPFIMTLFGIWAALPNIINSLTGIHFEKHFLANIFFLNPVVDPYILRGYVVYGLIILIYNLTAVVYLIYIARLKK